MIDHRHLANKLEELDGAYIQDLLEVLGLLPTTTRGEGVAKVKEMAKTDPAGFLQRIVGSGYDTILID